MVESPSDILSVALPGPTRQESVDLAIHGLLNLKEGLGPKYQTQELEKNRPKKRPLLHISCDDDSSLDSGRDLDTDKERPHAKRVRFEHRFDDIQPCIYPVHVSKEVLSHLRNINMLRVFRRPTGEIVMFMAPTPATNPHNPSVATPEPTCSGPQYLHPPQPETVQEASATNPAAAGEELGSHPMDVDEGQTSTEETSVESFEEQPPSSSFHMPKQNPAIRLCQVVSEVVNISSLEIVASLGGFGMRRMLSEEEILTIAEQFFDNGKAQMWRQKLQHPEPGFCRSEYLKQMSRTKNPQVKVIFQLLQCSDFFFSERGQVFATGSSLDFFYRDFESTLVRSLMRLCDESENSNGSVRGRNFRLLKETLPLAYFCISYLMTEQGVPLEHNLCQFLLLASCLEGRGVYHYRASNNLSMAHKAYRYMIERIGGKDYGSKSLDDCERAEKELKKTFEMF